MQQESNTSEGISSQLPLNQRILRLAIPNLIAAVSVPLIGIADTAMIGHLDRVAFLGAVASASVILDVSHFSKFGFFVFESSKTLFLASLRRYSVHLIYNSVGYHTEQFGIKLVEICSHPILGCDSP